MHRHPKSATTTRRRLQLELLECRSLLHAEGLASGYAYIDTDNDNSKDATELGVPGVVINLSGEDATGEEVQMSTLTDDTGHYTFGELEPGTYQITKRQATAMRDGQESSSVEGANAGDDVIENIVMADDAELVDNNFGELGLRAEYVNIRWFLASSPPAHQMLRKTIAMAEDIAGHAALAQTIRSGGNQVPQITNTAPIANNDSFDITRGGVLSASALHGVLVNDTDANNDSLTAMLVSGPSNGDLALNPDGSFTYKPDSDFAGSDVFTYTVNDGELASNIATVTLEVSELQATDRLFGPVSPGTFREGGLAGVRTDLQPGAPPLSADHVTDAVDYSGYSNPPTYGPHHPFRRDAQNNAITPRPTGVYEAEQPDEDMVHGLEHGHVWISYNPRLISSGDLTALRQFVIDGGTNTGVIMTPRAANDHTIAVASWARLLTLDGFDDRAIRNFVESNRGKSDGEGYIPSGQKNDDRESLSDGLEHTPPPEVGNTAPTAANDSYQIEQGNPLNVSANEGVLSNDSDAENDLLTANVDSIPSNGSLGLNQDGSFTYSPSAGFEGTDSFTYHANDGELNSNVGTVLIDVVSTNSAPVATGDSYTVDENGSITVGATDGVLSNDTDVDGDSLAADLHTDTSNGQLSLRANGSFTYTPTADFFGTDNFVYTVSDGIRSSGPVTVWITVVQEAAPNQPFGTVTPGFFTEAGLAGIRTDLQPGAAPLNATHVTTDVDYSGYSNPPTYGPHHPFRRDAQGSAITPRPTGVYDTEQPDEDMVHGLEHGHVWVSYNPTLISSGDLTALRQFVMDGGTNTGVIMTPRAANDHAIAVASWARLLTLDRFDANAIRNFVEKNRGKSAGEGFIPSGQKAENSASENLDDGLPH